MRDNLTLEAGTSLRSIAHHLTTQTFSAWPEASDGRKVDVKVTSGSLGGLSTTDYDHYLVHCMGDVAELRPPDCFLDYASEVQEAITPLRPVPSLKEDCITEAMEEPLRHIQRIIRPLLGEPGSIRREPTMTDSGHRSDLMFLSAASAILVFENKAHANINCKPVHYDLKQASRTTVLKDMPLGLRECISQVRNHFSLHPLSDDGRCTQLLKYSSDARKEGLHVLLVLAIAPLAVYVGYVVDSSSKQPVLNLSSNLMAEFVNYKETGE